MISLNHLIRMVNKMRVSTHFLIVNSPSSEYKRQIRVTSMMYALSAVMKSKKNRKFESCRYASTSFIKTVLTLYYFRPKFRQFQKFFKQCFFLKMSSVYDSSTNSSTNSSIESSIDPSIEPSSPTIESSINSSIESSSNSTTNKSELGGGGGVGEAEDQEDEESGDLHAGDAELDGEAR